MFNVSNIKVYFPIARRHYTVEKSKPAFPGFMLLLASVCQNWTLTFSRWVKGTEQDSLVRLQLQMIRLLQSHSKSRSWAVGTDMRKYLRNPKYDLMKLLHIWFFHNLWVNLSRWFHSSIFTPIFSLTTLIWLPYQKAQRTVMCSTLMDLQP